MFTQVKFVYRSFRCELNYTMVKCFCLNFKLKPGFAEKRFNIKLDLPCKIPSTCFERKKSPKEHNRPRFFDQRQQISQLQKWRGSGVIFCPNPPCFWRHFFFRSHIGALSPVNYIAQWSPLLRLAAILNVFRGVKASVYGTG